MDFVIDRSEFLRLTEHVPTVWIYAFVRHALELASSGDRGSSFFLQFILVALQLRRDPQFSSTLDFGGSALTKALIDETLESTVPMSWLRKRKRECGNAEVIDKRARQVEETETNAPPAVPDDDVLPFDRFVAKQLARLDLSIIDERPPINPRSPGPSVSESTSSPNLAQLTQPTSNVLDSMWHVLVKSSSANPRPNKDEISSTFIRNILVDRDFRVRIRTLLRDPAFNKWSLEAIVSLDETLVHQLSDATLRSLFFAYVYTVRFLAELPVLESSSSDPSMGLEFRLRANDLLDRLLAFFPCRFTVNTKTMDTASAMSTWLEQRISRSNEELSVDSSSESVSEEVFSDFDSLVSTIGGNSSARKSLPQTNVNSLYSCPDHYLYTVDDVLSLPRSVREAIVYHCLVVHIFCDLNLVVSVYMLRLLLSFLFPGVENRTSVIVRGSSGSGKSQFFDMVREFYNCASNGVISTQALATGRNVINTEMMPIGENLLCQIDEPKRVDNETFKLSISLVPIPTRSFSNQIAQSIPVLAKLVFTVNNMFQIESDDGILERLHCVFRLSHKHYNLVNEQTDMTRYNSGASYNISHQFTDRIFPRDVDRASFSRGMFHVLHHWSIDQTTRPDASYILADQIASLSIRLLLTTRMEETPIPTTESESPYPVAADQFSAQFRCHLRESALVLNQTNVSMNFCLLQKKLSDDILKNACAVRTRLRFSLSKNRVSVNSNLHLVSAFFEGRSFYDFTHSNIAHTISRWRRCLVETDFSSLISDRTRNEHVKRLVCCYTAADKIAGILFSEDTLLSFTDSFAVTCRRFKTTASQAVEHLFLRILTEFDSDIRVDISTLPSTLDMHLLDLQMSIDSFVRFKRTFAVEYSATPLSADILRKQLSAFVNEVNTTIDDAKYRVKLKDFFDRFETEYAKLRYRRPDTNQVVSNLWSVRLRRLY